mgnify:CR=1 FL=1
MLVAVLYALLLATMISFAGSVQLGPVNFGTIHTALQKNKRAARLFGLGGSLPELLYCGLAFGGSNLLAQFEGLNDTLKYLTSAVLLAFGIYLLFQKPSSSKSKINIKEGREVYRGALFGLLNPQLFPFWLFIITYLRSNQILKADVWPKQLGFIFGAALGAFLLQLVVAEVASRKREFIYLKLAKNYNKVLGCLILVVAVAQFVLAIS